MVVVDDRKRLEAEFHDSRERDRSVLTEDEFEATYTNSKWYSVTRKGRSFLDAIIAESGSGAVALDYCCGWGGTALKMAQAGATVYGIDISAESIEKSKKRLADSGLSERAHFAVMDAENMTFPDGMFDLIVCSGVLHHLDVRAAYPQLARVLKPKGKIVCLEALGYNPIMRLYRKLTPKLRTAWEAEHILTLREVKLARSWFDAVDINYFYLASILAVPLRKSPIFEPVLSALERVDDALLRLPLVQTMAWQMMFVLSQPKHR